MIFSTFLGSLLSCFAESYHTSFCNQSRQSLDFSVWLCSCFGCADLCKVTLLFLWILCGILSVPQGIIRGSLVCSKSLTSFVLLIFSASSVGTLWVYCCLGQFLCVGSFGSICSFLWSSIRVRLLLVSICSLLELVCREWSWISWTRNRVFCHGLAFSSLIFFSEILSKSMCISPFGPSNSLVILFIPSAFSLCFSLPYVCPKLFGFFCIR